MGFWWFMFICDMLVPVIMIIGGRIMWKHCPKEINGVLGYRTKRSMKNKDTWKFAHEYCGKLWWKLGFLMFVLSASVHIPFIHSSDDTLSVVGMTLTLVQCLVLILSVICTERELKKTFSDSGLRK